MKDFYRLESRFGTLKVEPKSNQPQKLCRIIISQMLSNKVSKIICDRFEQYSSEVNSVDDVKPDELRDLGLSWSKSHTIVEVLKYFTQHGEFDSSVEDHFIRSNLKNIKGVGDWTIDIFLLSVMGRENIFPKNDVGILNGLKLFYEKEEITNDFIEDVKSRWDPECSIGCLYMWKLVDEG